MEKYLRRLCNNILAFRFNEENYRQRKSWFGKEIQTSPLFSSYGVIGFSVSVYDDDQHYCTIDFDAELHKLHIDEVPWKDYINILYLSDNGINQVSTKKIWDGFPRSIELECYTDGGEDMLIDLEEPTKEKFQDYIDNFDINHNVSIWWEDGCPGRGVPFSNIKEHYEDYEKFLKWIQKICDKIPF